MQAFAGAVKAAYPNHLRLSIHQSTGEHKISLSLLNTKTGFTTPWHCSVALMATGEWLSAPKGDLEQDTTLRVVEQDGRPSFFRQEITPSEQKDEESHTPVSGVRAEDTAVDNFTNQGSSNGNDSLVGNRTSKGSSTAETTQSDSSQDLSPQKCEAPMPEVCPPQKKGTTIPIPTTCHLEATDKFKVGFSVESFGKSRACNTDAFVHLSCSRWSRISDPQKMHAAPNTCQEMQKSSPMLLRYIDVVKCNIHRSLATISQTKSCQPPHPPLRPLSLPIRDSLPFQAASRTLLHRPRRQPFQCRDTLAP